ncbi:hypothetical protein ACFO4O_01055 [Glaciecola siphonariae]|uniref:Uncharacterized protein n=1 Tax=Glaciecola siphonariae TaxID=521012 RepID=A0ABV9LTB9_9ALTE
MRLLSLEHAACTVLLCASLLFAATTHAQQGSPLQNNDAQVPAQTTSDTPDELVRGEDGVLRLEQTIRANREQPQVLTIVPWQLPSHQRIDETQTWQSAVTQLPSIERNQFLRDLAVVDDILALPTREANTQAQTNPNSNSDQY